MRDIRSDTWMRIVCVDPGLATHGLVVLQVQRETHRIACTRVEVFTSEPRAARLGIELADDRVGRTRALASWLRGILDDGCSAIAAEAMSFPRGSNAITCICLAWGVLCAEAEARRLPMIAAAPLLWRKHLARSGKERAAHAEAVRRVPSFVSLARRLPTAQQAHALDALGVGVWSVSTNMIRAVLA